MRLPGSGLEKLVKPSGSWNVNTSVLITLWLSKYGCIVLEKRRSPMPFKSRLVFSLGFA